LHFFKFSQQIFDLIDVLILDIFRKELFESCEHIAQKRWGVWGKPHLIDEVIFALFRNNKDIIAAKNDTGLVSPGLVQVLEGFVKCGLEGAEVFLFGLEFVSLTRPPNFKDYFIGWDAGDGLQGLVVREIRTNNPGQFNLEGALLKIQVGKGFIQCLDGEKGRHENSGCKVD